MKFAGMAPFDQIEDYYALGNIFVSASTSETQGLTYIEALASGMPLLVRQDDCLDGILWNYENGIGYENTETFCQGLAYLDAASRQQLRFSPEAIQKSVAGLGETAFALHVEKVYQNRIIKQDVKNNEENHGTIHAA